MSNYFQYVRHWRNLRVPLRLSRRELRLSAFNSSIRSSVRRHSKIFFSAPPNSVFSGEPPSIFIHGVSPFSPICTAPLSFPRHTTSLSPQQAPSGGRPDRFGDSAPTPRPTRPLPLCGGGLPPLFLFPW
jgi:hypothetical protein